MPELTDAKFFILIGPKTYKCINGQVEFPPKLQANIEGRILDLFESAKGGIPVYIELKGERNDSS